MGDRIGHRNLLCGMRATYAVLASILVTVALAGGLTPTIVFLIAGATGMVRPSDLGVRLSMMAGIVGPQELTAATGVARTTSDFARVGGALTGAGMFAAFGIGNAYIAVVGLYLSGLLSYRSHPARCIARPRPPRAPGAASCGRRPGTS